MSSIRILPDEVANRIAAGEVIERPASVVKELIENALDAGASRISVRLGQGGAQLIQVSDNGCGMDRDDLLLCIEPHATSKIRSSADIDCIRTLGFRGEALPSIASVSQFAIQTRPPEAVAGTELLVDGGTMTDLRECGCPPGTTVSVRRLFHNMPARRKFLRRKTTEEGHVHEIVLLHALGAPGVSFELYADGRCLLQAAANADGRARAAMLLGRETAANLLPVEYRESDIQIRGFVARPGATRTSRREQRFFINARPAASPVLYAALRDTYGNLVVKGRYPPVLLYLDMPPDHVDVNVHPGKKEVRFRDPHQVGEILGAAVRRCLQDSARGTGAVPRQSELPRHSTEDAPAVPTPPAVGGVEPRRAPSAEGVLPWPGGEASRVPPVPRGGPATSPRKENEPPVEPAPSPGEDAPSNPVLALRVIGTFADSYLVAEGESGLVLIDQRAAHERILYERLLANRDAEDARRQPLLMPVTLELTPRESQTMKQHIERFNELGFTLEQFGGNTVLLRAVPAQLPGENLEAFLREVLQQLDETGTTRKRADELLVARAASRSAVTTQETLAETEVDRLLADLARTEMPYTCPGGRPVMVNLPHADIARRFGRDA